MAETPSVCEWLAGAGYIPCAALSGFEQFATVPRWPTVLGREGISRVTNETLGWAPEFVTTEIMATLQKYRDVFAWLMQIDSAKFRQAIGKAFQYTRDERIRNQAIGHAAGNMTGECKVKDPVAIFKKETKAPSNLDLHTLRLCLQGTGTAMVWPARFWWYPDGRPVVTIETESPLNAIGLSVHVDRNFSMRRWAFCARCGNGFEQSRGRDRFCSNKCRNYLTTTERRRKIGFVKSGLEAWSKLPKAKQKGRKRGEWIAARAQHKSNLQMDPLWVKQQLTKLKIETQERGKVRKNRKEEEWHS
jgi:hypothetical protein